jgi:hypothetical protein
MEFALFSTVMVWVYTSLYWQDPLRPSLNGCNNVVRTNKISMFCILWLFLLSFLFLIQTLLFLAATDTRQLENTSHHRK